MKVMVALAAFALFAPLAEAAAPGRSEVATGFLFRSIKHEGRELQYVIYVPRAYDPSRAWPLILFLHGMGESGTDGSRQLAQGLPRELVWNPDLWPFIVIMPQKPTQDTEWEQYDLELMALVAQVRQEYAVDPARLVITGLSQGGHGAWVLGARHPELWAAVVPVCGYAPARWYRQGDFRGTFAELADQIKGIPVWAFHGEADDVVAVGETRAMVDALKAAGAEPRATLYPGVGHGCWERAYGEKDLPGWLLAQHKRVSAQDPTPVDKSYEPQIMTTPWGQKVVPDPSVAEDMTAWAKLGPTDAWPDRASAWWKDPANTSPKVVQHYPWRLTAGLYVLGHEDDSLPVYLFDTGSGLLLIDSAFADWGPSFEQQIRQTGRDPQQVKWVIVTHYHGDHSGGVPFWKKAGAEIWAPAGDADQLRKAMTPVDRTFSDGAVLVFGNLKLRAIATPGHTPGSTCFYSDWMGKKILFGEDIALHAGRQAWMGGPDSNWDQYLASLEKLCTYQIDGQGVEFEMLLPGHGTVDLDHGAKSVRDTRDIVREIVARRKAGEDISGMDVYKWQWEHRSR